jgi:carbon catabolite-derepressing protein kinase
MLMDMEPLGENAGRFFMKQIIKAIKDMHKNNICHRDLKPENMMLDQMLNVKIIDFGLTNRLNDYLCDIENLKTLAGTPQF